MRYDRDEQSSVKDKFGDRKTDVYEVVRCLNCVRNNALEHLPEDYYGIKKTDADAFIFNAGFMAELYQKKICNQYQSMRRGEVWWCEFGEHSFGSEMRFRHPALVIQHNDPTIDPSNPSVHSRFCNVIVVPLTHADRMSNIPFSLVKVDPGDVNGGIALSRQGYADVANIRCVSRARLTTMIGEISGETLKRIEGAIIKILGLRELAQLSGALQRQIDAVALRDFQKSKYRTAMDNIKVLIQANAQIQESDEGKQILKLIEETMDNY